MHRAGRGSTRGSARIRYWNGDKAATVAVLRCETPIGEICVAASALGVVWAGVGEEDDLVTYAETRGYFPGDGGGRPRALAERAALQIEEYFEGRRRTFSVPLDFATTTEFHAAVLDEVAKRIPFEDCQLWGCRRASG
jgi:O6-methylguanine-DNA--protein-cysteine methyltransferase